MRVLVIDNYDSFVYNLVQYLGELGVEPIVHRNDALSVADAMGLGADAVLVSPGPGRPEDAGISCDLIAEAGRRGVPVLGVCLGHQALGAVHGAEIVRAPSLMHGKTSEIHHDAQGVFEGLDDPLVVTRYHSLVIDADTVPDELEIAARSDDGVIMAVRHRASRAVGVQFHPESILSAQGHQLLRNWLDAA